MVDGKEAGVVSPKTPRSLDTYPIYRRENAASPRVSYFHFNRDGSHLAYATMDAQNVWRMVMDGKPGPALSEIDPKQIMLRGSHLVYLGKTSDGRAHVVAEGKLGVAYDGAGFLLMTDDGAHYAFIGQKAGSSTMVVDGAEGPLFRGISDPQLAPDGRVAYLTEEDPRAGSSRSGVGALMVDHREIARRLDLRNLQYDRPEGGPPNATPESDVPYGIVPEGILSRWVAFSPDKKRFAYVQKSGGGYSVVVDGKSGPEYDGFRNVQFSQDGKHLFYIGGKPLVSYVVADGKELEFAGRSNTYNSMLTAHTARMSCIATVTIQLCLTARKAPPIRALWRDRRGSVRTGSTSCTRLVEAIGTATLSWTARRTKLRSQISRCTTSKSGRDSSRSRQSCSVPTQNALRTWTRIKVAIASELW